MVSLLSSRRLKNEVLEDQLLRITRGRKLPWIALYGIFTSVPLLGKMEHRWENHQAFTFTDILLCLLLVPFVAVIFVLIFWLVNRYITYPLVFRVDESGLIAPTGRLLAWFRPTSCELIQDPHLSHVYHLFILNGKRLLYDVLLDDPSKATPFIAQFEKVYGSQGTKMKECAA